jgi:HK97 family phage major capsid protein
MSQSAPEAELADLRAKKQRMLAERDQLADRAVDGNTRTAGVVERIENVDAGIAKVDGDIERVLEQVKDVERRRIADAVTSGRARVERGVDVSPGWSDGDSDNAPVVRDQSTALRTIERYGDVLRSDAADNLDDLVRRRDPTGIDGRYIAAVGDPAYNSAFGKMLADPSTGHLRFSPQEVEAVRRVSAVMYERGMVEGTGSAGGFGIPFTLDPSILLTSNGALNPIRQVATVITIGTREWKGVSSAGVTASYDAEATEVSDDTPTLAQPTITTAMGRAFVPFSIELSQDWATLQQELVRLITDARDVLDAVQFYSGTGTDSPAGVRTGLTTTQRVQTDVAATFDVDDAYDIKGQLPARFMPNATWAAHPTKWDTIFRFTPSGSTTEPQALPTRDGQFIGRPKIEWTAIPTALTTGTTQLLYGDFRAGFRIADRLGMTAEIVQHLLGAAGRRPTGERGLFCYWRTGSKTVVPEALRYLETL